MMRKIVAAMLLMAALVLSGAASAQQTFGADQGYCYNSSLGSPVGITGFTDQTGTVCNGKTATVINSYTYIAICAYVSNVNWVPNGGTPTASVGTGGQQLAAGQCMYYTGTNPAGLRFIQQSAGAIVGITIQK